MQPINSKKTPLTFDSIEPGAGLAVAMKKSRADIIGEVAASNLRGRGGAGFPTGTKWNLAAAARVKDGEFKYVVCNADEGEPGTFKDRVLLLDYADLVFEGMTIAARAIGAARGILYLRGEYVYMRAHLDAVLDRRRKAGQLGRGVLGVAGFDFDIEIRMGAGAYVCGEETALIESLEGHRGEPRNRPPFPVDTGFLKQPTVVNNVETLASVTAIMARGAAWFKGIGSERSAGFKLFSVSGDCDQPGVYEFPLGITVKELLAKVGGSNAKAVQVDLPHWALSSEYRGCDAVTGASIDLGRHLYTWDMKDLEGRPVELDSCVIKVEAAWWPSMKAEIASVRLALRKDGAVARATPAGLIPFIEAQFLPR